MNTTEGECPKTCIQMVRRSPGKKSKMRTDILAGEKARELAFVVIGMATTAELAESN